MIKVRILDPEKGDQVYPEEGQEQDWTMDNAVDMILEQKAMGKLGFAKFEDNTLLDIQELQDLANETDESDVETLEMMQRTGIMEQLEERVDAEVTVVPPVGGG